MTHTRSCRDPHPLLPCPQLSRYLRDAFPRAQIIARNGAIPATSCSYIYMCFEMSVDEEVGGPAAVHG